MSDETLEKVLTDERKFIHDISNHLLVAHGMATFVLRSIKNNTNVDKKEIERLEKSIEAVNKITELLKERRNVINT